MECTISRRGFLGTAAAVAASGRLLYGQQPSIAPPPPVASPPAFGGADRRSVVGLARGESRRKNICESLLAIEERILPLLAAKKYVVIKPNLVSARKQLASTHVDALHGILDFLGPRFKGPVVIAESSAGLTAEGYDNFRYRELIPEHKSLRVSLVDLNEEGKYVTLPILNGDLHFVPARLAARLVDPDAFIICAAVMKTHNAVVATLSIKNMALGAPLHSSPKEKRPWNDKRIFHGGVRQTHVDIALTAQKLQPFWGATVIDGFEGMEGNGPIDGTAAPSRIAVASTDYVAADRVGIEAMGIDASWVGYLNYCARQASARTIWRRSTSVGRSSPR